MRIRAGRRAAAAIVGLALLSAGSSPSTRGQKKIRAEDMSAWLEFLSARELEGRNAPSRAYDIAARYVALEARRIGLRPLLPGGEWMQPVPIEVSTVSPAKSRLRVRGPEGERDFAFPQAFGLSPRLGGEGRWGGGVVFIPALPAADLEAALAAAAVSWSGKIVLAPAPSSAAAASAAVLTRFLRAKGAAGLLTVVALERDRRLADLGLSFDVQQRVRFPSLDTTGAGSAPAAVPSAAFIQVEVRRDAGAALLGLSRAELDALGDGPGAGPIREMPGRSLEIVIGFDVRMTSAPNVIGWLEGSDPGRRGEYVVISSHLDHLAPREGRILPGADDDGSGVVAMLSVAKALAAERPRRSIIFLWNAAEEDGLVGAYHFVQHCPVPVDKISADLNLDMISRNDPGRIYLIGSDILSSELDRSLRLQNERFVGLKLDDAYASPSHPDRFFFRSDHYPFIRCGIPAVWFFCGTTPDYHQDGDAFERADLAKAARVARLVFRVAMDIGDKPGLLKLDRHPQVRSRGAHNMKVAWIGAGPSPARGK